MQLLIFAFALCCTLQRLIEAKLFPVIRNNHFVEENEDIEDNYHSIFRRDTRAAQNTVVRNQSTLQNLNVPEGYSIHDPPPNTDKPTLVEFGVLIFNVRDIREINEELSLELRLQLSWKDSRLLPWVDYIEEGHKYMILNPIVMRGLWYPDIFIDYVKSISQPILMSRPAALRLYKDTQLRYSTRVTITMSCPMTFQDNSYNTQVLQLAWRAEAAPLQLLEMEKPMPNFQLEMAAPQDIMIPTSAGVYSGVRFTVLLRRRMKFHLLQTYLPSTLFVIISWLSFLVPREMVSERIGICMTTLLTLTSMFAAVRQDIPKVSYIKALDIWMVTCVLIVFLALMEHTIVLNLKTRRLEAEKRKGAIQAMLAAAMIDQKYPEEPSAMTDGSRQNDAITLQPLENSPIRLVSDEIIEKSKAGTLETENVKAPRHAKLADILIGQVNSKKTTSSADLVRRCRRPLQPLETPPARYDWDDIIEKYVWSIIVSLFFLFNFIYWPWLLSSSEYNYELGDTQYYSLK